MYDIDDFSENAPLNRQEYIGELEFMLHEIVTQKDQTLKRALNNAGKPNGNNGEIYITGEEQKEKNNEIAEIMLEA